MRDGLPHAKAPDKVPSFASAPSKKRGSCPSRLRTGILIGIRRNHGRAHRFAGLQFGSLHEKYGHIQKSSSRISRQPEIPMAAHPEPSLEDMLRTIALARLISDRT